MPMQRRPRSEAQRAATLRMLAANRQRTGRSQQTATLTQADATPAPCPGPWIPAFQPDSRHTPHPEAAHSSHQAGPAQATSSHDDGFMVWQAGELVKKRGRRRRNPRTQRPASITVRRVGTGRATELTTFSWVSPPTAWDAAAAAMSGQVRKAERQQKKVAKARGKARRESRKESKREGWRDKYRKGSASPFENLPGMAGRTETTRARSVVSEDERRQTGMAHRGPASTLTPTLARQVLELRAAGMSYREIAQETGHPATTVRHWVVSGRASAVSEDRGQTRKG